MAWEEGATESSGNNGGSSATDGSSDGAGALLLSETLPLTENCRTCLAQLTLYENGMVAYEAAARSIAKRVCHNDLALSHTLIQQVRCFILF